MNDLFGNFMYFVNTSTLNSSNLSFQMDFSQKSFYVDEKLIMASFKFGCSTFSKIMPNFCRPHAFTKSSYFLEAYSIFYQARLAPPRVRNSSAQQTLLVNLQIMCNL